MSDASAPLVRYLAPSEVAELLSIEIGEVIDLVLHERLRGARLGSPARWRIEAASVDEYIDEQREEARQMAIWHQVNEASIVDIDLFGPRVGGRGRRR